MAHSAHGTVILPRLLRLLRSYCKTLRLQDRNITFAGISGMFGVSCLHVPRHFIFTVIPSHPEE